MDVVVRCVEGESFHNPIIRTQSFSGPVILCYDLHKCFSAVSRSGNTGRVEEAGVKYSPWPPWFWLW